MNAIKELNWKRSFNWWKLNEIPQKARLTGTANRGTFRSSGIGLGYRWIGWGKRSKRLHRARSQNRWIYLCLCACVYALSECAIVWVPSKCECECQSECVCMCLWVCIINALYDHLACHLLTALSQTKRTQYTHNLPSSYSQYSIYPITSTLTRLCVNFESTIWHYNYVSNHPVNTRTAQKRLQELHQYKAFSYCSQRPT